MQRSANCAIGRFYPSVAASEAICEIAWESDRRFAGTREIEVRHRVKAAGEGSFANARVRIEQKRLRFLYSDSREIVDEIHSRGFLEHLAKVIPADISRLGYAPEGERLCLMLLDELPRPRHVRGFVFFAPDHQLIRQNGKVLRKNIQEPQHRAISVWR